MHKTVLFYSKIQNIFLWEGYSHSIYPHPEGRGQPFFIPTPSGRGHPTDETVLGFLT